jgi:hypothetical protein
MLVYEAQRVLLIISFIFFTWTKSNKGDMVFELDDRRHKYIS